MRAAITPARSCYLEGRRQKATHVTLRALAVHELHRKAVQRRRSSRQEVGATQVLG
jgi:hypothetical protein